MRQNWSNKLCSTVRASTLIYFPLNKHNGRHKMFHVLDDLNKIIEVA